MAAGAAGTRAVLALLVVCSMAAGAAGTSTDRAAVAPGWGGSVRAARDGGRLARAHGGAPVGVRRRGVQRGLRGFLAGSQPCGWAPGRVRERRAWGEERRRGRLRRGTSAAGGAGGTEAPRGSRGMAGPGRARHSRRALPQLGRRMPRRTAWPLISLTGAAAGSAGAFRRAGSFSP